jgi:osmotically-inducible protein OsmY
MTKNRLRQGLVGAATLIALGSCKRGSESREDFKDVSRSTEKAAKDIGHAATDLADEAGKGIEGAARQAGEVGDDAWITTKVKSELATSGFDPLHVHVDTADEVVTLSGMVGAAADARKAVELARGVKGVAAVQNHLVVKPPQR